MSQQAAPAAEASLQAATSLLLSYSQERSRGDEWSELGASVPVWYWWPWMAHDAVVVEGARWLMVVFRMIVVDDDSWWLMNDPIDGKWFDSHVWVIDGFNGC